MIKRFNVLTFVHSHAHNKTHRHAHTQTDSYVDALRNAKARGNKNGCRHIRSTLMSFKFRDQLSLGRFLPFCNFTAFCEMHYRNSSAWTHGLPDIVLTPLTQEWLGKRN